jgi:hypothetical protein
MKNNVLMATLVAMLLSGCAAQKQSVWEKPGASGQDFEMDRAQCNAQAFSVPGVNMFGVVMIQNQCLRGKGWYLTDTPNTAPSVAQRTNDEIKPLISQIEAIAAKSEYRVFYEKAPKVTDITFTHLSDKSKMTVAQKETFLALIDEVDPLNSRITTLLRQANDPKATRIADLRDTEKVRVNQLRLNLIDQKITWGEYNLKRQEFSAAFNSQFQQINSGR